MIRPSATTLVIPIHSEKRWSSFIATMDSVRRQDPAPAAIIVCVDHNLPLLRRVTEQFPQVRVVENSFARGAAGARNSGAHEAETPLLVFLDSDIRARDGWLCHLLEPFADRSVIGCGGLILPNWPAGPPAWFPDEFGWVVGVSYRGQPSVTSPVRNIWSANMAVRREAFDSVNGFRVNFSKVDDSPKSEDTDFCLRVTKQTHGGVWMFVPAALVEHEVNIERSRFLFFVGRCFSEGKGKIDMAHINLGRRDLEDESKYMRHTTVVGLRRYMSLAIRNGDAAAARQGAAVFAGLGAASLGAVLGQGEYLLTRGARLRKYRQ